MGTGDGRRDRKRRRHAAATAIFRGSSARAGCRPRRCATSARTCSSPSSTTRRRADRRRRALSLHRPPAVADHRRGGDVAVLGQRHQQRAEAALGAALERRDHETREGPRASPTSTCAGSMRAADRRGNVDRKRLGAQLVAVPGRGILLRVTAGAIVLVLALALSAAAVTAHGRYAASVSAQPNDPIASVPQSDRAFVAVEATDVCLDDLCGADRAGGDPCSNYPCCDGHGLSCSGVVVAPAATDFVAPSLSSFRLTVASAPALAGVTRSPDERPPRLL